MGKKVKVEAECDRCGFTQEVTPENKATYGDFPKEWEELDLANPHDLRLTVPPEKEYLLCTDCTKAFEDWWNRK